MLTLVVLTAAPTAEPAASKTIRVRNDRQLQAAVSKLANSARELESALVTYS